MEHALIVFIVGKRTLSHEALDYAMKDCVVVVAAARQFAHIMTRPRCMLVV
jgi:hypothetical protein